MRRIHAALTVLIATGIGAVSQEPTSTDARIEMLRKRVSGFESQDAVVLEQARPAVPTATPAPAPAPVIPQPTPVPTPAPAPPQQEEIDEEMVNVEADEVPEPTPNPQNKVWVIDPRAMIPSAALSGDGLEQTGISMQRGFLIAGFASEEDEKAQRPVWTIRKPITIPIMHRSRTLSMTKEQTDAAKKFASKLAAFRKKANEVEQEAKELLDEWNEIVRTGAPVEVLAADSPSLPVTQGGEINMSDTTATKEGFIPGQGISFSLEDTSTPNAEK